MVWFHTILSFYLNPPATNVILIKMMVFIFFIFVSYLFRTTAKPLGHVSTWTLVQCLVAYLLMTPKLTCTVVDMHCGVTAADLAGDLRSTSTVIFIQVISIKHEDYRGMSSHRDEAE